MTQSYHDLLTELRTHVANREYFRALEIIDILLNQEELSPEEQESVYHTFEEIHSLV